MKRFLIFCILIINVFCINAQKDVYVLVDLSKTMCPNQLQEAKVALSQILKGTTPATLNFTTGDKSDLQKLKLEVNDRLSITEFGDREFTWRMRTPSLTSINNTNIDDIVNSIRWVPNQNWTFLTLAKAKIAEFARKHSNKRNIILCIITDDGFDDFPPNVYPRYTDEQNQLITKYQSKSEGVNENSNSIFIMDESTKRNQKAENLRFVVFTDIKIANFIPSNPIKNSKDGINIITPTRAQADSPFLIYSEDVKVEWECTSKLTNLTYSVIVTGYEGNNFSYITDTVTTKKHLLKSLPNGKYEIIVSANNSLIVPDTTFIEVSAIKDTKIKITSPVGTKKKPNKIKGQSVNVSWRCVDCDVNTTYTITLAGTDGNKATVKPVKVKNFATTFNNLASGKYRITVSGTNGASSDTTYIEVSSGGAGAFFIFLLLAAIAVGVFLLLKKMKKKKPNMDNSYDYDNNKPSSSKSHDNNDWADDGIF